MRTAIQSDDIALKRVMEIIMRMMLVSTGATVCQLMFREENGLCVCARAARQKLDVVRISLDAVRSCTERAKKSLDGFRALIRQPERAFLRFDVHAAIREVVLHLRKRIEGQRSV